VKSGDNKPGVRRHQNICATLGGSRAAWSAVTYGHSVRLHGVKQRQIEKQARQAGSMHTAHASLDSGHGEVLYVGDQDAGGSCASRGICGTAKKVP